MKYYSGNKRIRKMTYKLLKARSNKSLKKLSKYLMTLVENKSGPVELNVAQGEDKNIVWVWLPGGQKG